LNERSSGAEVAPSAEDDDLENRPPDEDELRTNIVIQDAERGPGYTAYNEGDEIASAEDWDALLKAVNAWMKKSNYYPSVYYMNERGNIETVSPKTGKFIGQGWV